VSIRALSVFLVVAGCGARSGTHASDASTSAAADLAPQRMMVYVSGYSPQIASFSLDNNGQLTAQATTAATGYPSYAAVDPSHTHLYAVNEAYVAGSVQVDTFAIDGASGALTPLGDVGAGGNGPVHIVVDNSDKWLLIANYGDGSVNVLPVGAGTATQTLSAGAMAHQISVDPAQRFVFVPCEGTSELVAYHFDATAGTLTANTNANVTVPSGSGPRHLTFAPNGQYAYLISELASTMTAYAYDHTAGSLTVLQTLPTVAAGITGNTAAEVAVHPSGKFLYGSNRGDDSIVIYSLAATGMMTLVGYQKTGGTTPRDFTIDPSGRFLLVVDQDSNDLREFAIDGATGLLTAMGAPFTVPTPSFVGIVTLP
jgi:6-phosphogluconolactonase